MNISAVTMNKPEEVYKNNSINVKSNAGKANTDGVGSVFENVSISSSDKMQSTTVESKGLASIMDDISSVEDQLKNSALTAKDSLKALFNKMSGGDCVKMDEDGYDLNSMKPEEIVTVVDRIKIMLATYCDDYKGGEDIDISKIKAVVGDTGMADKIAAKLKSADLPATQDNTSEVKNTLAQAGEITPLSEEAKNYLVSNKLEPSIQNIYKAEHASLNKTYQNAGYQNSTSQMSDAEWTELKPQVESLIKKSGLDVNKQNLDNAKVFIENDIPVTEENLVYKNKLDTLDLTDMDSSVKTDKVLDKIINNMMLGNSAKSTLLTGEKPIIRIVSDAIQTINTSDISETVLATVQGEEFTIASLRAAKEQLAVSDQSSTQVTGQTAAQTAVQTVTQKSDNSVDAQAIANYRQLEEIRILMTADAGVSLVKQGFNLDTTSIANLVEQLKTMESQLYGDAASSVLEVKKAMYNISTGPDVAIGAVLIAKADFESITIADFSQMGSSLKQKFKQAEQTYEAVGTQVRGDLGDSVSKAVTASTESILAELELEDTKANRDAVRILGYNNMEMTKENISTVKEVYSTLNNLIDNMKPETVLSMIKNKINPMNSDIKDVNEYLSEENEGLDSVDKFSKFLYKLDRTDGITAAEREQFIGIYKMMNIFKKDAGKAVGTLVKQDADVTMANLMTAFNSNKAAGIDETIDVTTGMAEISGTVNYYNNLFEQTAEQITPKSLKTVNEEKAIASRSVENFCESVNDSYDGKLESEYYEQYIKDISKTADVEESVIRQLTGSNQQVTIDNIMAVQNIMSSNYFQKFRKQDKEGTSDTIESFIDKAGSESELNEAYQQLADQVTSATQESLNPSANQTYSNIEELRMMGKEIGVIKNLSQKHDYKIPFVSDGEVGTINLQIVEDSENKGRIAIKLSTDKLGTVSIEGRLSSESASIFAVTDKDETMLADKISKSTESIEKEFGIHKCEVYVGKSNEIPDVRYNTDTNEISFKALYSFAKTLVVGILKDENVAQ